MDKIHLEKFMNDSTWSETLKLYSGLFDLQEDRDAFIIDITDVDIVLAAKCTQDSISKNELLENKILDKAKSQYEQISNSELGQIYPEFLSVLLIKPLNRELIIEFLNSEPLKKKRYFTQTLNYLINNFAFEDLMDLIYSLKPEDNNLFIRSILKALYKRMLASEDYDKINSILSAMVIIGQNPSGILDSIKSRNIKLQRNMDVLSYLKNKYSNPKKRKYMNFESLSKKLIIIFDFNQKELDTFFKVK